ncbi:unnamed protein product [Amaranthus hypochondriacus]
MGETVSGFSVCDLYPSLSFISTISGMKRKLQKIVMRIDRLMDPIIEDHKSTKRHYNDQQDLVDVLLKFHKHDHDQLHDNDFNLTSNNIKAIVLELFGGASDTTSTTIEWAFSELLKNPKAMKRAQDEVRQAFQGTQKMVEEASLHKLKYLKCVIKETFRLHPAFPCLLPRESMEYCEIEGYEIPPQTRIFINAWAIGRDSRYWEDPEKFIPERFESSLVDYKGTYFELIPFGSGRRICPGMGLGIATIELALAMLLYHFDWELPHGCKPQDMDMDEALGIVGRRKNDLYVIPSLYFHSDFI